MDGIRFTQAEIAASVVRTASVISNWFSGLDAPGKKIVPALAKALAHGDEGREQDYLKRLRTANLSTDIARSLPAGQSAESGQANLLAYSLQLLGDLGLSQEKRDALSKDGRLIGALDRNLDDRPVIDEAGYGEFAEANIGDPMRRSALRLALANLKKINGPE